MERRGTFSFAGPAALGASLVAATIFHAEGTRGFLPFLNLEALFLVLGGTLCCLSVAYPACAVWRAVVRTARGLPAGDEEEARLWGEVLRHGADSAMGMGGAATILGLILMLSSIDDVSAVPRRMALSLSAIFYGLVLSEAFFAPLARRVRGPDLTLRIPSPGGGQRRLLVGLGSAGSAALSFFIILYALSAAVAKDVRKDVRLPQVFKEGTKTIGIRFPFIYLECERKTMSRSEAEASGRRRLDWARPVDFKSEAYSLSYLPGEEFILEEEEGRGAHCQVRRVR